MKQKNPTLAAGIIVFLMMIPLSSVYVEPDQESGQKL